jgi:probable DNA repair protein
MGDGRSEIDEWLRGGGLAVAASDRAARAMVAAFDQARRAEGLGDWAAPNVRSWKSFVRDAWNERRLNASGGDECLLLNPTQERALWVEIAGADRHLATLLEGPRYRIAALAMEAHELICAYAPQYLREKARGGWQQDAAAFGGWLKGFDEACRAGRLVSESRLALEAIAALEGNPAARPPLLLVGFDRVQPTQRELLDAWGAWREAAAGEAAGRIRFFEAPDQQAELAACALWFNRRLAANPGARLLVVTQEANERRGEMERAFLKYAGGEVAGSAFTPLFEFSLGIPLGKVGLARAATLTLRWLSEPLREHEIDWLISAGHTAADSRETAALEGAMRKLRRKGLERMQWSLTAFLGQRAIRNLLPSAWAERMREAQSRLLAAKDRAQSPPDWAKLVGLLLETVGWPGGRTLTSAQHQAAGRWGQAVEAAGSLGFDGRRIGWAEFLSALARCVDETLFAPESREAPIQIAGPAESAGLTADGVWFLGAGEEAWPGGGAANPLLPSEMQRQAGMPHASAQLDWELARTMTVRLLAAAPEVNFSYARQAKWAEARPARLIAQLAGAPQPLPLELQAPGAEQPRTIVFEDFSRIPFAQGKAEGGSSVLTSQSQCPFKAFATARLGAQGWRPAEAGLTAAERGKLLHAVLHTFWGGPPQGIRTHAELLALPDREGFVGRLVHRVLREEIRSGLRERMPRRYLELEERRLTRLVNEWLDFEAERVGFEVAETEAKRTETIAGLTLDLRLDRVDRLIDGSLLVIDYKSGAVSPKSWDLPRPDDVQLPLYAGFALDGDLGGLVFAKVRAGDQSFAGRVGDAKATLLANLSAGTSLARNPLTVEQLMDWRDCIRQLSKDFLSGKAEVDPREYPKTCERCGLETLCRIQENRERVEEADEDSSAEATDE